MLKELSWYRVRGYALEMIYASITKRIWGVNPHHKFNCKCGGPVCQAWKPVDAFRLARRGIV